MAGKFEVYEDKAGKFRFRLKSGNGETVASGEAYDTKAAAKAGCEAVQRAAKDATKPIPIFQSNPSGIITGSSISPIRPAKLCRKRAPDSSLASASNCAALSPGRGAGIERRADASIACLFWANSRSVAELLG